MDQLVISKPCDCEKHFEGPEKILEVDFIEDDSAISHRHPFGLRNLERKVWDTILREARCEILSVQSNNYFDAYVLSESSLFVYKKKAYIKTCGTTTLLRCLGSLLTAARTVGLIVEWVGYSRKDFLFPSEQNFPHTSFAQEINYAQSASPGPKGGRLEGGAFVLGDLTTDHWFVYVADYCERDTHLNLDRNINIMMYDLDPSVRKLFYRHSDLSSKDDAIRARKQSGLESVIVDGIFDDVVFEPCGYSLNVMKDEAFYTVHITPEDKCCYASFETNAEVYSYEELLKQVLSVFKPKRFTIAVFADKAGLQKVERSPVDYKVVHMNNKDKPNGDRLKFIRTSRSSTCFATDYVCQLANFVVKEKLGGVDDGMGGGGLNEEIESDDGPDEDFEEKQLR